jgi:hypothetical protein
MSDSQHALSYEGRVHVRPVGRGIVLEDEPGEPHIEDWITTLIAQHKPVTAAGGVDTRLRIAVEWIDDADA